MRKLNKIGWIALSLALVLPLVGCDAVQSVTGAAAKALLERASGERLVDDNDTVAPLPETERQLAGSDTPATGTGGNVYYQYVDDSGSVRFVRDRGEIPRKFRDSAGRLEVEPRASKPTRSAAARSPRRDVWKEAAEAPWSGGSHEVVMYTAPWCGVCRKAEAYFRREGVRYTAKDIEASDTYKRELVQKIGRSAVPVIEIDDQRLVGWDERRVASLLTP